MRIGILAELTGTSVATIRYYEAIGLLRPARRQSGGQRAYDNEDLRRLSFVRRCRDFGFPLSNVRSLLSLSADRDASCSGARDLAETNLASVRRKLDELKALERAMAAMVETCDASCAGGPAPACSIFADLSAVR
jgi:MerR family transcriptional regulator, copper efflux regulator